MGRTITRGVDAWRPAEQKYLEAMGSKHVAHEGFHDAPLLEKLKAIDAALHVAEAERLELAETREKLMKVRAREGTQRLGRRAPPSRRAGLAYCCAAAPREAATQRRWANRGAEYTTSFPKKTFLAAAS